MFRLVVDIHLPAIPSLYWEELKRHAPCHILRMSVNGASTMFSFASWVIYVPIGCRHPLVRYWQPVLQKTTATMGHQRFLACHLGYFMFRLVEDIHLLYIGSLYWEKLQRHAPCRFLRMSVNGASTIFSFSSWVIYIPLGCRHPFVRYWQPLIGKPTVTCSLPHPENQHQRSVNKV